MRIPSGIFGIVKYREFYISVLLPILYIFFTLLNLERGADLGRSRLVVTYLYEHCSQNFLLADPFSTGFLHWYETSWDWPKSAPYPRLIKAKGLPRVNLQYTKIEKAKKWTEWRAGTLPKLSTFFSQWKGGLWRKNKFRKKAHNAEKNWKGGTLWSRPVWFVTRKNHFCSVR